MGLQPNTVAKLKATYQKLEGCVGLEDMLAEQSHLPAGTTPVDEAADISASCSHPGGRINPAPFRDTKNQTGNASQRRSFGCGRKRPPPEACEEAQPRKVPRAMHVGVTSDAGAFTASQVAWRPPPPPPPVVPPPVATVATVAPVAHVAPWKPPVIRTDHDPNTSSILDHCRVNDHGRVALHLLKSHSKVGESQAQQLVVA